VRLGKVLPDELEHEELVEIGVEQRSRDRIEPPVVVVRSPGKINNHDAFTLSDDAATASGDVGAGAVGRCDGGFAAKPHADGKMGQF
jgi:hypothetical protein